VFGRLLDIPKVARVLEHAVGVAEGVPPEPEPEPELQPEPEPELALGPQPEPEPEPEPAQAVAGAGSGSEASAVQSLLVFLRDAVGLKEEASAAYAAELVGAGCESVEELGRCAMTSAPLN
jgi:hypothetical protein